MITLMSITWNDFVLWCQNTFGWLNKDAVTGLLIMLSVLMALLLVFLVWEFASDIRSTSQDKQENKQANNEQESQSVAISAVYDYPREIQQLALQDAQSQVDNIVPQELRDAQIELQMQDGDNAVDSLLNGIALVMPQEDETGEMGIRYDRSFTAKLIQADDKVKEWYSDIKNYLLSFRKVHARISWSRESFRIGKDCFARLAIKGKTLCVYLAIIPKSCQDTKYKTEEVDLTSLKNTPCLYRIKSARRVSYAKELIDIILQEYDAKPIKNRQDIDYYLPYEGTVDLIKKGLIKRKIVAKRTDFLSQINAQSNRDSDDSVA